MCDFGVTEIVCSKETVDLYNPKVVQATMGSIARLMSYVDLNSFLSSTDLPVLALYGRRTFIKRRCLKSVVVMGNEAMAFQKSLKL
jgi:TrmH family RNA methyltransferase